MFKRDYTTLKDLRPEELENLLAYFASNDEYLFGEISTRYIQVDVTYSRYSSSMRFKITFPTSWIKAFTHDTTVDMVRRGMLR